MVRVRGSGIHYANECPHKANMCLLRLVHNKPSAGFRWSSGEGRIHSAAALITTNSRHLPQCCSSFLSCLLVCCVLETCVCVCVCYLPPLPAVPPSHQYPSRQLFSVAVAARSEQIGCRLHQWGLVQLDAGGETTLNN